MAADCDEYAEAWKVLEVLEGFAVQVETDSQKLVEEWDTKFVHIKLRQSLVMGETVDYFIDDPEVMSGDDFLHEKLTAKEIAQAHS
jgi:hypothetical protein